MKFKQEGSVIKILDALEDRGHLTRERHRSRSIALTEPVGVIQVQLPPDLDIEARLFALRARCSLHDVVVEAVRDGFKAYRGLRRVI